MAVTNAGVIRALTVLDHLSSKKDGQRLMDIAAAVGLHESTTQRLLNSLVTRDYVQQHPLDGKYRLGWRIVHLCRSFSDGTWLIESMRPYMQQLAREVKRSINLAVLQNNRVIPLECVIPEQPGLALYTWPGTWFPAHATALGKTLLAHLPPEELRTVLAQLELKRYSANTITDATTLGAVLDQIRSQGYCISKGEYIPEEKCVAAPIMDAGGVTIAAISVTARGSEFPTSMEMGLAESVTATADQASRALFGSGN